MSTSTADCDSISELLTESIRILDAFSLNRHDDRDSSSRAFLALELSTDLTAPVARAARLAGAASELGKRLEKIARVIDIQAGSVVDSFAERYAAAGVDVASADFLDRHADQLCAIRPQLVELLAEIDVTLPAKEVEPLGAFKPGCFRWKPGEAGLITEIPPKQWLILRRLDEARGHGVALDELYRVGGCAPRGHSKTHDKRRSVRNLLNKIGDLVSRETRGAYRIELVTGAEDAALIDIRNEKRSAA